MTDKIADELRRVAANTGKDWRTGDAFLLDNHPPVIALLRRAASALDAKDKRIAELEAGGWQPISTAPKDWRDILLFDPEYEDDFRQVFEGYYSCEDGGRGCWVDAGNERVNPTHWQPLPAPPSRLLNKEDRNGDR